jgi:hypothetical protein
MNTTTDNKPPLHLIPTSATGLTLWEGEVYLAELLDTEGAVPAELEAQFLAELERATTSEEEKREAVGQFIRSLERRAKEAREESRRISERARKFEGLADRVREYVVGVIKSLGTVEERGKVKFRSLKGKSLTLSLRALQPSLEVVDESAVPESYKLITVTMAPEVWRQIVYAARVAGMASGVENATVSYRVDTAKLAAAMLGGNSISGTRQLDDRYSLSIR